MKLNRQPFNTHFYVWNGLSAGFFSSNTTPLHSHNTIQLIFDLQNGFRLRTSNSEWNNYKCLVIKESVIHQLHTNGSIQLIMYLEAQSEVAKRIKEIYLQKNEICSLPIDISSFTSSGILQQLLLNPDINLIEQIIHEALSCLLGEVKEIAEDERIKNIRYIITTLNIEELNISSLASKIYLSESRLRSLFKKSVGVSLHKYIVWHKIIRGINSIINGASVLEAALNAGFSDSSHFHKMTVKMFGVSPSQFIKNNKNLKIIICDNLPMKMETTFYNEKIIPVEKKKW